MITMALYNLKGGVGKTATAVNLGYLSALSGARTLVWDLDPQGAASYYFRIRPKVKGARKMLAGLRGLGGAIRGTDFGGLDLLPADFSYRHLDLQLDASSKPKKRLGKLLRPLARDYDRVFLDCPPGLSLLSESVFVAADALLVPTIPTTLSLRALDQVRRHLKKKGPAGARVWPFFCQVDRRKGLHRDITSRSRQSGYAFLEARIPYSTYVERMGIERAPVAHFAPASPPSRAYIALHREMEGLLGQAMA